MELLDKKLTGPGPEISVHPGVTFIVFFFFILFYLFFYLFLCLFIFFVTFFLTENREATCFTEEHST